MNNKLRKNQEIKSQKIRLIHEDKNVGIFYTEDALRHAKSIGLDLVEISPNADPPVCKMVNFGKFLYEESKKDKKKDVVKNHEVKFGVNIDVHDFNTKINTAKSFLIKGDRVKITIQFKGRQNAHPELGFALATRIINAIEKLKFTEPKYSGKSIIFYIENEK